MTVHHRAPGRSPRRLAAALLPAVAVPVAAVAALLAAVAGCGGAGRGLTAEDRTALEAAASAWYAKQDARAELSNFSGHAALDAPDARGRARARLQATVKIKDEAVTFAAGKVEWFVLVRTSDGGWAVDSVSVRIPE